MLEEGFLLRLLVRCQEAGLEAEMKVDRRLAGRHNVGRDYLVIHIPGGQPLVAPEPGEPSNRPAPQSAGEVDAALAGLVRGLSPPDIELFFQQVQRILQGHRTIAIPKGHDDQELIEQSQFEQYRFVPGYEAIWRPGTVECALAGGDLGGNRYHVSLHLAICRHYGVAEDDLFDVNDPDWVPTGDDDPPLSTLMADLVTLEGVTAKLGTASAEYLTLVHSATWRLLPEPEMGLLQYPTEAPAVFPQGVLTLSLEGQDIDSPTTARQMLERFAGAIAFHFDVNIRPDAPLRLVRCAKSPAPQPLDMNRPDQIYSLTYGRPVRDRPRMPMPDPALDLDPKALSLYWAARSAVSAPLYQFIAYYQVMEYFFPHFTLSKAAIRARDELRRRLLSGDFDPRREPHLSEIVGLAQKVRSPKPELEQLEAAILQWVSPDELAGVLEKAERRWQSGYSLAIDETELSPTGSDERKALARRFYGIRCRIVHTKFAGGPPPILPASPEAEWLEFDVQLAEFVAQKALLYHASRERLVTGAEASAE